MYVIFLQIDLDVHFSLVIADPVKEAMIRSTSSGKSMLRQVEEIEETGDGNSLIEEKGNDNNLVRQEETGGEEGIEEGEKGIGDEGMGEEEAVDGTGDDNIPMTLLMLIVIFIYKSI